jgi:putative CocE/NonD family hydrolase
MAGIVNERNSPCAARDGVDLATDVFRPDDDRRHPVLLQRTPYDKGSAADPLRMVEAGYAVAIQDVRGRFASGGTYDDLYLHEAADGTDAVGWAATQPWSDGNVGMYGISYMGACQWLAAVSGHPALRALAPVTSPNDLIEDHVRRGGALQLGLLASWTLISMAPAELRRRAAADPSLLPELVGLVDDIDALDDRMSRTPLVPFSPVDARAGGVAPWFSEIARQEVRGPQHDARCISHRHDQVLAPALQIAGWYDALLAGDLSHFVSMRREAGSPEARSLTRLVVGPWSHATFTSSVGELDFGVRAAGISLDLREDLTGLHRRWFDQRLRGIDTGIDDEPAVRLFVMGRNRWQGFDDWPPAGAPPGAMVPAPRGRPVSSGARGGRALVGVSPGSGAAGADPRRQPAARGQVHPRPHRAGSDRAPSRRSAVHLRATAARARGDRAGAPGGVDCNEHSRQRRRGPSLRRPPRWPLVQHRRRRAASALPPQPADADTDASRPTGASRSRSVVDGACVRGGSPPAAAHLRQ